MANFLTVWEFGSNIVQQLICEAQGLAVSEVTLWVTLIGLIAALGIYSCIAVLRNKEK